MEFQKDLEVCSTEGQLRPKPGRSEVMVPPCTPRREPSSGQRHQSHESSDDCSSGSESNNTSAVSTSLSSAPSSPQTPSSTFKSDNHRLSHDEQSPTPQVGVKRVRFESIASEYPGARETPLVPFCESSILPNGLQPIHAHLHTPVTQDQPDTTDTLYLEPISLSSFVPKRLVRIFTGCSTQRISFFDPPPLDLNVPTTFGPYISPHTLGELHRTAWTSQNFPMESCLQCSLKKLECPFIARSSPTNAHLGPLVTTVNGKVIVNERISTAHPRFPACLRCIRNGEADCCIVQRRATMEEIWAFQRGLESFSKLSGAETATVIFPTDRDVTYPELFAAKLAMRDELLQAEAEREKRMSFAPSRQDRRWMESARMQGWDGERMLRARDKDRALLSDSKGVLLPHEAWGSKWVGRREREEIAWISAAVELNDSDGLSLGPYGGSGGTLSVGLGC
ncbi:hypothetical protein MPH_06841 [Macrophomina phaseolina MS6]|uniref:Uncharacterized protein n=1 Tax=Macrophomina phaseolina (strain MS6) TaxID=1126212 RepID=K2R0Y2_MACPH|nr:hypothetical protein MPH_06841 [Macrophomina phaseolina MS6]